MKIVVKRLLVVLACLLGVGLVLALPSVVFWLQWMTPRTPLPESVESRADESAAEELPEALRAAFAESLVEQRAAAGAPAMSAAIAAEGRLLWAGTRGLADVESEVAATVEHRFRIGSVSKAVTGALLGRLVASGILSPVTPVREIVAGLPPAYDGVTVGMLASHTAGVRHYRRRPTWIPTRHESLLPDHFDRVEDGLELFLDDPLLFTPGTDFHYSTFGFSLLSRVMESATGRDFATLLRTEINEPAGIDIQLDDLTAEIPSRVGFYTTGDGRYVRAFAADPSYKWAGGGLLATPSELAELGLRLLLDGGFVAKDVRRALWTPVALPGQDSNPENYGFGWRRDISTRLLGEEHPTLLLHHGGLQIGGSAFWMLLPEHGVSVAVMANSGAGEARGAVQEAAYALARALIEHGAPPVGPG